MTAASQAMPWRPRLATDDNIAELEGTLAGGRSTRRWAMLSSIGSKPRWLAG
jgi:hypothetical protein